VIHKIACRRRPGCRPRGKSGPRLSRLTRHAQVANAAGAQAVFRAEVIPRGVEMRIVAQQQAARLKFWIGLLELEQHGFVGVIAVVQNM